MTTALYNRDILRLAAAIPCLGRLPDAAGSAERRAPLCGSRVIVDVVADAAGRVTALGQEVHACALGQASAALMARHAVGSDAAVLAAARDALAAYLAGTAEDPGDWPGLEIFSGARGFPARHASILLPFDAAAAAALSASPLSPR